jgi:hypothetical protein
MSEILSEQVVSSEIERNETERNETERNEIERNEKKISRQQQLKSVEQVKNVRGVLLCIRQRFIANDYLEPFGEDLGPGEEDSDWDEGYPDPSFNDVIKLLGNRAACVHSANDSAADKRLKAAVIKYGMDIQQSFSRLSTETTPAVLAGSVGSGAIRNPVMAEQHAFNRIRLGILLEIAYAAVTSLTGEEKKQAKRKYLEFVKQLNLHGKSDPQGIAEVHQKSNIRIARELARVSKKLPIIYSMVGGNLQGTSRLSDDAIDAFLKYIADISLCETGFGFDYDGCTFAEYYTGELPARHMRYAEGGAGTDFAYENAIEVTENEMLEELNERLVQLEAAAVHAMAAAEGNGSRGECTT